MERATKRSAIRAAAIFAFALALSACGDRNLDGGEGDDTGTGGASPVEVDPSCTAMESSWPQVDVEFIPSVDGGPFPGDATCTVVENQLRPNGGSASMECAWGLTATGEIDISWNVGEPLLPAALDLEASVLLTYQSAYQKSFRPTTRVEIQTVRDGAPELVLYYNDGYPHKVLQGEEEVWSPLHVELQVSDCPTVAGGCNPENFIAELRVERPDEAMSENSAVEVVRPYSRVDRFGYQIRTGELVIDKPNGEDWCHGDSDDQEQILIVAGDGG